MGRGVERCGPWERRTCRHTPLRHDPARPSSAADRSDATSSCGGADPGAAVSALSQRLAARRGKTRAIMAVAHSIVVRAFQLLSRHQPDHA